MVHNQQFGDITLDEIPGLSLALASPGEQTDITVLQLDGTSVSFSIGHENRPGEIAKASSILASKKHRHHQQRQSGVQRSRCDRLHHQQ